MDTPKRPPQLVFSSHTGIDVLPIVAFLPLVIAIAVFAGMTLTNHESLDEWRMSLLGIGAMSLLAFSIAIIFVMAMRWWHIRLINQIYNEAWAVWKKYNSEEQWQRFAEKNYQSES